MNTNEELSKWLKAGLTVNILLFFGVCSLAVGLNAKKVRVKFLEGQISKILPVLEKTNSINSQLRSQNEQLVAESIATGDAISKLLITSNQLREDTDVFTAQNAGAQELTAKCMQELSKAADKIQELSTYR